MAGLDDFGYADPVTILLFVDDRGSTNVILWPTTSALLGVIGIHWLILLAVLLVNPLLAELHALDADGAAQGFDHARELFIAGAGGTGLLSFGIRDI